MRLLAPLLFTLILSILRPSYAHASAQDALDATTLWTDEMGASHPLQYWDLKSPVVLTMIYSQCRKTCPNLTFKKLREIQSALESRNVLAQFFIATLDPKNDTPEVLNALKKRQAPDQQNWHFIRGTEIQTRVFADKIGLGKYWEMDDHIQHNFRIVYYDPKTQTEHALTYDQKNVNSLF